MRKKILTTILVISAGCLLFGVSQNVYACQQQPPTTPPNAVLIAPSVATHSGSTQFDGSSSTGGSGTIVKYEWDWNNDSVYEDTTATPTATHVFNLADEESTHTYNVTLKVTNSIGPYDTDTKAVTVRRVHRISDSDHYGYDTISAAISAASSGDTVEVGDGTYTGDPNKNLTWDSKSLTVKSANGPSKCIIDCGFSGRGFNLTGSNLSPSVISGFTIQYGSISGNGGGILCSASGVTIENCVLMSNGVSGGNGGGIAATGGAPTIKNCAILKNGASFGSGIYCTTDATITDCTISNYPDSSSSSGIYCVGAAPTISFCTISGNGNSGGTGGGIYLENCSGQLYQCVIANNTACTGGGIYCGYGSTTQIDSCRILRNSVCSDYEGCRDGAAIYCQGASPTITNCVISDNVPSSGNWGSGIYGQYSDITIKNCTFYDNERGADLNGASLYCDSAVANVINCIFWHPDSYTGKEIKLIDSYLDISHSDLKGGESGISWTDSTYDYDTDTMKTDNPCFKELGAGDYRLDSGSPCLNTGDSIGVNEDIIGTARSSPDIGAYEGCPSAQTISVRGTGANYTAIQRAIDWANNEDTVQLADGVYKGVGNTKLTWTYNDKQVTVKSQNGTASCAIDCENLSDYSPAFYLDGSTYPYLLINLTVDGLTIINAAGDSGIYTRDSAPLIENCVIKNCSIYSTGSIYGYNSSATIRNCTVTQCSPSGIYFQTGGWATVENCTITNNSGNSNGAGIYNQGSNSHTTIRNCLITGNKCSYPGYGGGIRTNSSNDQIINCTIAGNLAWFGGGIYGASGTSITNCIVWANSWGSSSANEVYNVSGGNVNFSCIKGGWNNGEGNIGDDPCFVSLYKFAGITCNSGTTTSIRVNDTSKYDVNDYIEYDQDGVLRKVTAKNPSPGTVTFANDPLSANSQYGKIVYNWGNAATSSYKNYHLLSSSSPCVDVGDPSKNYSGQTDIDGEDRVIDIPDIGDDINDVDMGADEFAQYPDFVGWWKFDDGSGTTARDSTGQNDAPIYGATWANGIIGGALSLDGVNDYVSTSSVVMTDTQDITMAGWVYWNATSGNSVIFYNGDTGTSGYGVLVNNGACEAGNKIVVLIGGINCDAVSSSTTLPTNTWTHVALTREGTAWKLYVNGDYKHTGTTNPNTPAGSTLIGAGTTPELNNFNGLIDDVRIYDRALSAAEIQALYQGL